MMTIQLIDKDVKKVHALETTGQDFYRTWCGKRIATHDQVAIGRRPGSAIDCERCRNALKI